MNRSAVLTRTAGAFQRRAARWLGRRVFAMPRGRALVSFTFDDFPRSALIHGGAILERLKVNGTYYAALGLAGEMSPSGEIFALDELRCLLDLGHELGCHTFGHRPAWETAPLEFEASVRRNAEALQRHVPGAQFRTLSYPISYPRPETKLRVGRHFCCCRGGGQTFNTGTVDLNYLSAFFLEQSAGDLDAVKRVIIANQVAGGWLILATHDVAATPTRFGCTPTFFAQVARFAVESGAEILPVGRAWDALQTRASIFSQA
jgi:peptidoglycan/xylan/chitin deacetylase (PgdA/CDA1 family)